MVNRVELVVRVVRADGDLKKGRLSNRCDVGDTSLPHVSWACGLGVRANQALLRNPKRDGRTDLADDDPLIERLTPLATVTEAALYRTMSSTTLAKLVTAINPRDHCA